MWWLDRVTGTFLRVPIIRVTIYWVSLYWGLRIKFSFPKKLQRHVGTSRHQGPMHLLEPWLGLIA